MHPAPQKAPKEDSGKQNCTPGGSKGREGARKGREVGEKGKGGSEDRERERTEGKGSERGWKNKGGSEEREGARKGRELGEKGRG